MELITPRLLLREFQDSDFDSFRELETSAATYYYESRPPDEQETRQYLAQAQLDAHLAPRVRYRLAVTRRLAGRVIGRVTLARQNASIREWEIGWALHPAAWGQGLATEAAWHLADFAFGGLGAHRLVAFCHAKNLASTGVMARLGMQAEGPLRETRWWQGQWADEWVYGLLERDWARPAENGQRANP